MQSNRLPELSASSTADRANRLHVGIIMDGNGRWAAQRSLPRFEGHRRGVDALRRTVRAAMPPYARALISRHKFIH